MPQLQPRTRRQLRKAAVVLSKVLYLLALLAVLTDFRSRSHWLVAGIFIVVAASTKYLANIIWPRPGTVVGCSSPKRRRGAPQKYRLYVVTASGRIAKIQVDSIDYRHYTWKPRMFYPYYKTAAPLELNDDLPE